MSSINNHSRLSILHKSRDVRINAINNDIIDNTPKTYNFNYSNLWFDTSRDNLSNILNAYNLIDNPINILEIGTFEGQSTLWFLTNVCTHSKSRITTVDMIPNSKFIQNVAQLNTLDKNKLTVINSTSANALKNLNDRYDVIYIDGSHFPDDVLEDSVLAFQLLKIGGLLIFDDYHYDNMTYLSYISNDSQNKYETYYKNEKDEIMFINKSINLFASIYAPRLIQIPSLPQTAVFKKISNSFSAQCEFK